MSEVGSAYASPRSARADGEDVSTLPTSAGASLLVRGLILLVRLYRLVPRVGPPRCRFYPTCSSYAIEALEVHGALRGIRLVVARLLRCHPFHPGGVDRVPPRQQVGADPRSMLKGSIRV